MEKPEEEILLQPEYAILEFGDGYIALIQGATEQVLEDGRKVVRFMIKPSNILRKRYRIGDNQLNQNGQMPFIAETKDLIPISPAAHFICGGVKTDLNGKTNIKIRSFWTYTEDNLFYPCKNVSFK